MGGAFLYLSVCSMRNRLSVRLRRLREPRYFLGLTIGVAYVALVLTRPTPPAYGHGGPLPSLDEAGMALGVLGAAGLLAATALAWILPGTGRPALTFSRADVQFLFTAPVSRRQLLHYKVFRSQAGAMLGSALVTLVVRPRTLAQGWTFFLGMLLVMATVNLHLTGVSLRRESLRAHGAAGLLRQWVPLAVMLSAVVIVATSVVFYWPSLSTVSSAAEFFAEIERISNTWIVWLVLWPFMALMQLPLSGSGPAFFAALPVGLAAFFANYLWVLRSDVAFEETAARDAEQQVARRRSGGRYVSSLARRRAPPFQLAPRGRPEIALLWKNLILSSRVARWGVFWRVVPIVLLGAFTVSHAARTLADALATVCALGAVGVTLIGPQILRNDLRQDLAQIATLKQWPITGGAIVRGEVLAPTVLLSAIVWIFVILALLLSTRVTFEMHLAIAERVAWAVAAMFLSTGIMLVEIVAQNVLAILFPAWMDLGATSSRGMEVMGQRVLIAGGLIVTVGLSLFPAILVGLVVGGVVRMLTGVDTVVVSAAAASLTLVGESALVVTALGRVVDRMDASAVPSVD
jgi:hypothetical protein